MFITIQSTRPIQRKRRLTQRTKRKRNRTAGAVNDSLWTLKVFTSTSEHNWCFECSRDFNNPNALTQHQNSLAHKDRVMQCPFCKAMTRALRASRSMLNLVVTASIDIKSLRPFALCALSLPFPRIVVSKDLPCLQLSPPSSQPRLPSTGSKYECYLCHCTFRTLSALNTHLNSPAHDADEFKCPKCKKEFKLISGLVQHIESGVCNVAKFKKVEKYYEDLTAAFTKALKF